jgi:hypothetical protein
MAWPWVPAFLDGARCDELRVRLAEKGLRAGLDVRPWDQWLGRWFVDVVLTGHPSGVHDAIRFMGLAAECLLVAYGKDMRS